MVDNYPDLKLYIAGEWRHADGQPVINPADESTLAIVPHASRADLGDVLAAAGNLTLRFRVSVEFADGETATPEIEAKLAAALAKATKPFE
jgi:hypothetical protein